MCLLRPPLPGLKARASSKSNSETGFTLIEVLISILILAVGIMGALKMEMLAMQSAQQTMYFRQALVLAIDLSEKMQGNPDQTKQGQAGPFLKINYQANSNQPSKPVTCNESNCSPDQLAAADIATWLGDITASLPEARAVVCRDDSPWNSDKQSLDWECHAGSKQSAIVIKLGWGNKSEDRSKQGNSSSAPQLAIPVFSYNG